MAYATTAQLTAYLGYPSPSNATNLLERASDVIDYATMGRIDVTDTEQASVAQKATCQQVEYWLEVGVESDISGAEYKSISIGTFQATYNTDGQGIKSNTLAPRARRTLFLGGMLYRGVRMI